MIGSLRGHVIHQGTSEIVIDVQGVGYRVVASPSTVATLVAEQGEVVVSIHTHVREDAFVLYGFSNSSEREVFEILLGTHGVGPSLALSILGTMGAAGVVTGVRTGDSSAFEAVSGVGKKTAARLVLELQDSLAAHSAGDDHGLSLPSPESEDRADVSAALAELGYSNDEIRRAMAAVDGSEPIEQALRLALRELSRA